METEDFEANRRINLLDEEEFFSAYGDLCRDTRDDADEVRSIEIVAEITRDDVTQPEFAVASKLRDVLMPDTRPFQASINQ